MEERSRKPCSSLREQVQNQLFPPKLWLRAWGEHGGRACVQAPKVSPKRALLPAGGGHSFGEDLLYLLFLVFFLSRRRGGLG